MIRPLKTLATYRRLKRYRAVIFTFIKYGFDDLVDRMDLMSLVRTRRPPGIFRQKSSAPTAQRFRDALSDLGPTFVKLGQLLSTRPDILPENFILELEKLQDDVRPLPFEKMEQVFLEEFDRSPGDMFLEIEHEPTASASIAQVHKATLPDGTKVAVKIQRPGIIPVINTDLSILLEIAVLMERHIPELNWVNPVALVQNFSTSITRETDFISEFQSAQQFVVNFADDDTVIIPRVYRDYSSEKILVMDFLEGVKISDLDEITASGLDLKTLAQNGSDLILKEIFEHQFFHGDPHPGNLFAMEENRIGAIDFGMIGYLDDRTTRLLGKIFSGVINRDINSIIHNLDEMNILPKSIDMMAFRFDLKGFIDRYHGSTISEVDLDEIINDSLRIVRRHRIVLPTHLATVGRMMMLSTGIARKLDPDFDMLAAARPYVRKLVSSQFEARTISREVMALLEEYYSMVRFLPANLRVILNKLKKGQTSITLKHQGFERLIKEIDGASNRLSFSMIVAALIVGSSLIINIDKGPELYGYSALGMAGYLVAGVLGLWLVISILRSGKL